MNKKQNTKKITEKKNNTKKNKAAKPKVTKKKTNNQSEIKLKVSDQEFLEVLDKITRKLIHKFKFGYHSLEDMKQQASVFALEALDRYDGKRPLENFLWTHVRNRLFNFKRNNYQRPDSPCIGCKFHDKNLKKTSHGCLEYSNKLDCPLYNSWYSRNERKKNIMQPSYIDNEQDLFQSSIAENNIENQEIISFLDKNIDAEHREYYLKLKHGVKIKKEKFDKLKDHISSLLKDFNNNA